MKQVKTGKQNTRQLGNRKRKKPVRHRKKGSWAPLGFIAAVLALPVLDMTMLSGVTLIEKTALPFSSLGTSYETKFRVNNKNTRHTIKLDTGGGDVSLSWALKRRGSVIKSNEERYPSRGVRRIDFTPVSNSDYSIKVVRLKKPEKSDATLDIMVIENDRQLVIPIFDALGI